MNIRFGRLKILMVTIFLGPLLQGCVSKNYAPFHVYSSATDAMGYQTPTDTTERGISEVRVAVIGVSNKRK